ncbi:MAG: PQQ-binding-like beta-propeller repeat protein [Syntrophobacteraceae bacterium]
MLGKRSSDGDRRFYRLLAATATFCLASLLFGFPFTACCRASVASCPLVADGRLYIGASDGKLYALDASSGNQIWAAPAGDFVDPFAAGANGIVYASSWDGNVYAFDANTGNQLWTANFPSVVNSPIVAANGAVYFSTADGSLYALDGSAGSQLWVVNSLPADLNLAIGGKTLYASSLMEGLYAFDISGGVPLWTSITSSALIGPPVVTGDSVCIGSDGGILYKFDGGSGAQLWAAQVPDGINSVSFNGGSVYVSSPESTLYSFDLLGGNLLWTAYTGFGYNSAPVPAGQTVLVSSPEGQFASFDSSNGTQHWTVLVGGSIDFAPVPGNNFAYLYGLDQMLYAVDPATGNLVWTTLVGTGSGNADPPGETYVEPDPDPLPVDVITIDWNDPGAIGTGLPGDNEGLYNIETFYGLGLAASIGSSVRQQDTFRALKGEMSRPRDVADPGASPTRSPFPNISVFGPLQSASWDGSDISGSFINSQFPDLTSDNPPGTGFEVNETANAAVEGGEK